MHLALLAALWLSPVDAPKPVPTKKYATGAIPVLRELAEDIWYDYRKAGFFGLWWWTGDPLLLKGYLMMREHREDILKNREVFAKNRQLLGELREREDEADRLLREAEEKRRKTEEERRRVKP